MIEVIDGDEEDVGFGGIGGMGETTEGAEEQREKMQVFHGCWNVRWRG
jgi:hypothetical protein